MAKHRIKRYPVHLRVLLRDEATKLKTAARETNLVENVSL